MFKKSLSLLVLSAFVVLSSNAATSFAESRTTIQAPEAPRVVTNTIYFNSKTPVVTTDIVNPSLTLGKNLNEIIKENPAIASQVVNNIGIKTSSTGITTQSFTPQPGYNYVLHHVNYSIKSTSNYVYNVGPLSNQTFLLSVPKGKTSTLTNQLVMSATLTLSATLNSGIVGLIRTTYTGSISGTISKTYIKTVSYSGPDASSPYNSRNYYSAVDYDSVNVIVKQEPIYYVYSIATGANVGYVTGDYPDQSVPSVKIPKIVEYSKDVNY